jgi:hypothetical protein
VAAPAAAPAANTITPGWSGNNDWANNNAAPGTAAAPRQQATTGAWASPAAAAAAAPPQQQATTGALAAPVAIATSPARHQAVSASGLPPGPTQSQPPSQAPQAIPPIQFSSNVQTYNPSPAGAGTAANARPITPPGGRGATHTAPSSSASDNGMAGWNQGAGAPSQPHGGW